MEKECLIISVIAIAIILIEILLAFFWHKKFIFWFFYLPDCFFIYFSITALLEKCAIKTDSLTFYTPPLPPKVIKFCEITSVRLMNDHMPYRLDKNGLAGYRNKKMLFFISEKEKGYDLLLSRFLQEGKVEHSYQNGVEVRK